MLNSVNLSDPKVLAAVITLILGLVVALIGLTQRRNSKAAQANNTDTN